MFESEHLAEAVTPAQPARKPLNRTVLAAGAGVIFGAMLGVAGTVAVTGAVSEARAQAEVRAETEARAAAAAAEAAKPRLLRAAVESCGLGKSKSAVLGDNDMSLALDGAGEDETYGLSLEKIVCVLDAAGTPDSVVAQMDNTRALDGAQRESWGNISARWIYHPNHGFEVSLTEK